MSTEPVEENISDAPQPEGDDPVEPDPIPDPEPTPEPEPEPTPPPEAPDLPDNPIVFQPAKWYSVTWTCRTAGCPNLNIVGEIGLVYSNAGIVRVFDAACGRDTTILSAVLLDPQPEMS
ncbi:hypothetical protein [Streptomyces sp. NRRL F-5135]|uniref:hypothetical protein n=1 Tax=Streptomyces sp. NRRL F-5135 TaxID=1463858 RepID=UPI000566AD05|nr:hypothetical protein [Streptomyces sp. NRRL F-5135]